MFHVGQEVVCVSTDQNPKQQEVARRHHINFIGDLDGLEKGRHYHIASISWDPIFEEEVVILAEIKRSRMGLRYHKGQCPDSYSAWRFRPVQKRSTDISCLIALLNPVNHKKLEDA